MLGLYVSDHPLSGLEYVIGRNSDHEVAELLADDGAVTDGASVKLCGLICAVERKVTKKTGSPMAIVTLEDLSGSIEVTFFPASYDTFCDYIAEDAIVSIGGRVKLSEDGGASVIAQELTVPNIAMGSNGPLVLTVRSERCTREVAEQLGDILRNHPGSQPVRMRLTSPGKVTTVQLADELRVNTEGSLYSEVKALLGRSCLDA